MGLINKPSEVEAKRWFSTGFLASGVGAVAPEQHMLKDAAVIRAGEARGHEIWVDGDMCKQVMEAGNAFADKGLKARFGHPDMCSDALGTFLGRWKNLKAGSDGIVRGDLFLSSTAAASPKGDLRKYIEELAAKEPGHFGTSIVFTRDWEAEAHFIAANGGRYMFSYRDEDGNYTRSSADKFEDIPEGADWWVDSSDFKSPDANNVNNFRHARVAELHAGDLVDDPAATDSMFSGIGGTALAARVSEWLDTHPDVITAFSKDQEMLDILSRYPEQVKPFIERFTANRLPAPAEPGSESAIVETASAEPDTALADRIAELESLLRASAEHCERAEGQVETLQQANESLTADRDRLSVELEAAHLAETTLTGERDEAQQKLAALVSGGEVPLSGDAGEAKNQNQGGMWSKVRASAKKQ